MERDPVCGVLVDPFAFTASSDFEGVSYYFCSGACWKQFVREPAKFAVRAPVAR